MGRSRRSALVIEIESFNIHLDTFQCLKRLREIETDATECRAVRIFEVAFSVSREREIFERRPSK